MITHMSYAYHFETTSVECRIKFLSPGKDSYFFFLVALLAARFFLVGAFFLVAFLAAGFFLVAGFLLAAGFLAAAFFFGAASFLTSLNDPLAPVPFGCARTPDATPLLRAI